MTVTFMYSEIEESGVALRRQLERNRDAFEAIGAQLRAKTPPFVATWPMGRYCWARCGSRIRHSKRMRERK